MDHFAVQMDTVQTNMVYIEVEPSRYSAKEAVKQLAERGVHLFDTGPATLRAVTHLDVDDEGIEQAIDAFQALEST
jgi:threonine aldolase